MKVWRYRLAALVLSGVLALPLAAAPAQAAGYSDLPNSHWAYQSMMQAAGLGLINGVGSGKMDPSGIMTWGQFLAVMARTFAGGAYSAATAAGQPWDRAGYTACLQAEILRQEDGLGVTEDSLGQPITRQDAAVLLYHALPETDYLSSWKTPVDPTTLTDWLAMDTLHQQAVSELARRCIITGKSDGSFGCRDTIQRSDGAALITRVLDQVDETLEGEPVSVILRCVSSQTGMSIFPDQTVSTRVGEWIRGLTDELDVGYYNYDYTRNTVSNISSACQLYVLYFQPMSKAEILEAQFWEKVERGEASREDYLTQDFWLLFQGENQRKHQLLFGSAEKRRYSSREEAQAAMTTITVPVWKISKGQKVSSTMSLSIHAAIAQDVKEIFTEIYNDPERFPIHDVGGYSWRGDSATGEHNCGTAIDINANENYQIRDGKVLVGSCWAPGSNPYSISPNGSVVRIFAEHGWSWGGDAWAYDSDASQGYHDYMHFSYMGE